MLSDRIISTIKFFDYQDYPLTAFEIERYLISDKSQLRDRLNDNFELVDESGVTSSPVHFDTILTQLTFMVDEGDLVELNGFYCLPDRELLIAQRLRNYRFGLVRERLVRKYTKFTRHIPFVRGVALLGSQALGHQSKNSDIDLFIITEPGHMWLARMLVTIYFQFTGARRHGNRISNRFCLNHYLSGIQELHRDRNLYTAMEYIKMRPLVYPGTLSEFQQKNQPWLAAFFPNVGEIESDYDVQSDLQRLLEYFLKGGLGNWLEKVSKRLQLSRIEKGEFIEATDQELSFHPNNRKLALFQRFFEDEQKNDGEIVELEVKIEF